MKISPGPLSHGLRRPYVRVRQGFGDFLDLRERSSSYINAEAACPSQVEGFFYRGCTVLTAVSWRSHIYVQRSQSQDTPKVHPNSLEVSTVITEYANNLNFHSCFRAHSDSSNHPCYGNWRKRIWHPLKYIC